MVKHTSHRQLLVNAIVVVLVVYLLIFAVVQFRNAHCSHSLITNPDEAVTRLKAASAPPKPSEPHRNRPMPECAAGKTRAKTFLMVFMGHSGSTAILSELASHSHVFVTQPEPVDHQAQYNTTEALEITRDFFDRGIALGKTPGFKIRPMHILDEPEKWRALAIEYETRIIWQYRKNLLKSSVGEYSSRYLNDTSVIEGLRSREMVDDRCNFGVGCSFRVDNFDFFHKTLQDKLHSQKLITDAVHAISGGEGCVREVPYEEYLYEREKTLSSMQRFLGLDEEQTAPERFKATGDNLCDVVENWDELCTNFYGCVLWQHMLDDPRHSCFCSFSSGPTKYCDM